MGRSLTSASERRRQPRSPSSPGASIPAARLRTGSPLRLINTSPEGMLVESPVRLLPGRRVDVVLQSDSAQEQAPWVVIHSRVGCIRGSSDLRYRAGLHRVLGSNFPGVSDTAWHGNGLPTRRHSVEPTLRPNHGNPTAGVSGKRFG
jgi:hypothetical protein